MLDEERDIDTSGVWHRQLGWLAYHAVNDPVLLGEPQPESLNDALEMVGRDLLAMLKAAGLVVVDRERFERVRRAASACSVVYWFDNDEARGEAESAWVALQRGDTNPPPEVE